MYNCISISVGCFDFQIPPHHISSSNGSLDNHQEELTNQLSPEGNRIRPTGFIVPEFCLPTLPLTSISSAVNGNFYQPASTILDRYKVGKVIGDGNFAVVRECVER